MTSMEPTGVVRQSAEATVRGSTAVQDVALEHRRQSERRVAQAPDLVTIRGLKMHFPVNEGAFFSGAVAHVKAVDGISFTIRKGETLGLVGESGCGKTTTGRCILRLEHPTAGEILFDGRNLVDLDQKSMRGTAAEDPGDLPGSLQLPQSAHEDRRDHLRADAWCTGPSRTRRRATRGSRNCSACAAWIRRFADRYPHEMSGGQRQRVGIARALSVRPEFIICDEAISALDVSIQAQIINLLEDLRDQFGLTYLFIAHDLSVVRHLCHRVAVMYLGKIVELADCDELYGNPLHPYTQALLGAVPVPDPDMEKARAAPDRERRSAEPDESAEGMRVSSALPACDRQLCQGRPGASGSASPAIGSLAPSFERPVRGRPDHEGVRPSVV